MISIPYFLVGVVSLALSKVVGWFEISDFQYNQKSLDYAVNTLQEP